MMAKARRRHEEYQQHFTENDLLLVEFDHMGRSVSKFSVQYVARLAGEWRPIVRYDTAHGFAHMDISHPDGTQETREMKAGSYREALGQAIADLKVRWESYRERYERWMK
jgi:hypothetical protein